MVTYQAEWLFSMVPGVPPIFEGTLTVDQGRVHSIDPPGRVAPDVRWEQGILLPGFVNAHTHLDLSTATTLPRPTPGEPTRWLQEVIRWRQRQSPQQVEASVHAGLQEALRFGTTLLADITTDGTSARVLANAKPHVAIRANLYRELIGFRPERIQAEQHAATNWLAPPQAAAERLKLGLAPHAPYSTSRTLYEGMSAIAAAQDTPAGLACHLAEFAEESLFLEQNRGPFADLLDQLGITDRIARLARWTEPLTGWQARPEPLLLVHGNYATPSPGPARPPGLAVVYCPRTHAAFGHPPHPVAQWRAAGVPVVLGTDSRASNPDLDILAEARFLAEIRPDLPRDWLLRAITSDAAQALGWGDSAGQLKPGVQADFVVRHDDWTSVDRRSADPLERILTSPESRHREVYLAGIRLDFSKTN